MRASSISGADTEWCDILKKAKGVWAPLQTPLEVHSDPQAMANGYLSDVKWLTALG